MSAIIRYTTTVKFWCFQGLSTVFVESMVFWSVTLCRLMSLFGRVTMGSGPESVSPFLQKDVVCVCVCVCVSVKCRDKLIILKAGLVVSV